MSDLTLNNTIKNDCGNTIKAASKLGAAKEAKPEAKPEAKVYKPCRYERLLVMYSQGAIRMVLYAVIDP